MCILINLQVILMEAKLWGPWRTVLLKLVFGEELILILFLILIHHRLIHTSKYQHIAIKILKLDYVTYKFKLSIIIVN